MSEALTPKVISILRTMYSDIEKWYYTRELAKLAKVSTWVVSKEFSKLVKDGMVQQKSEGREKFFKLNLTNSRTRKLCELFETERREKFYKENRRLAWVLEDFTKRVSDFVSQVHSIVLFGSAARGQGAPRSDIDVLVVAPNSEEEQFKKLMDSVDKLADEVSGRYPAKLVPVVMMTKDFEKSIKDKKRFATDVLKDGIVLFGEERYYHLLSRVI
ncbi:MAG: nucleotidyltransferase domain-containing protein [Euryarchaeota archaeon]|nr:nucleotidyltransferase domain-containing protein [Euryarchaeota archaeon]